MKPKHLARFPKFIATKEYVEEGNAAPRGYGLSYRDYLMNSTVWYPLGLHLIVRWARDFHFWLVKVGYPGYRQRAMHRVFLLGVEEGIKKGRHGE